MCIFSACIQTRFWEKDRRIGVYTNTGHDVSWCVPPWVQFFWNSLSFLDFLEVSFLGHIGDIFLHDFFQTQDLQEYLSLLTQSLPLNIIKRFCGPGQVTHLVRVSSWHVKVLISILGQDTDKKQQMNARVSGTTNPYFLFSLPLPPSLCLPDSFLPLLCLTHFLFLSKMNKKF